jgi:hypothetical protein
MLVDTSMHSNRRVRDVAARLVLTGEIDLNPGLPPPAAGA